MHPLDGVRVLDLADESGVLAGRLLADLGAEVILVEPPGGNRVRRRAPLMDGMDDGEHAYGHLAYNAGKRSLVIDFGSELGRETLAALIGTADVLIETPAPGETSVLEHGDIVARPSGLISVSITPFVAHGPWSHRRGCDLIGAATGGILHVSGEPERPPVLSAGDMSYRIASLAACTGVLAALVGRDRARGGHGAHIDISVQECVTLSTLQTANANFWRWYGVAPPRNTAREFPIVRCKDGLYAVTRARPDRWDNIREWALGHGLKVTAAAGDWQAGNRSALASFRLGEAADLLEALARFYDRDEFLQRGAGTCFVGLPLLDFEEMQTNEHFAATNEFVRVVDPARGFELQFPKSAFAGMASARPITRAPLLGEHSAEVLEPPPALAGTQNLIPDTSNLKPLTGVRVLDISWVLAGPLATRILANLGAEVIKIESGSRMDALRRSVPPPSGASLATSGWFNCANTAKLSATINTTSAEGRSLLRALSAKCDVVLDNLRTGVVERMGLAYEELRKDNPGVIVVHMPGCGRTGPWANMASFGNMMTASGGVNSISGFPGTPPTGVGVAFGDFVSPYVAASAALAALRERDATGLGQEIEVAQLSGMVSLITAEWLQFAHTGIQPERRANRDPNYAPHGVFPARGEQEWLAIAVEGDEQFGAFAGAIGQPTLVADSRFATHAARKANEDALDAVVTAWTGDQDRWQAAEWLQLRGIAAAAVESIADQMDRDPSIAGHFHELEQPSEPGVTITVNGEPIRFAGVDPTPVRAPALGEHNECVFRELLGLPEDEFVRLLTAGVIA